MCGIISMFSNTRAMDQSMERMLTDMLWIDSIRGDHSTGLIYQSDDGVEFFKKAVAGYDFVQLDQVRSIMDKYHQTPYLIGHNRAATRGDTKSSNAHPFQYGHITGIHNGTISSFHDLSPAGFSHQVDSAHLYMGIAVQGFDKIAPQIDGGFNLLWHDDTDNTIHQCLNASRPYTFAKLKGKDYLIGASEKAMLKWLIGRSGYEIEYCWNPEVNVEYVWEVDNDMVRPAHAWQHEKYVKPVKVVAPYVPPQRAAQTIVPTTNGTGSTSTTVSTAATTEGNHTSGIELVEFFLDNTVPNQHLINGKRSCTAYGETIDGVEVLMYAMIEDELEMEKWYTGRGYYIHSISSKCDYYKIDLESVKPHPTEAPDEALHVCINCGEDHYESGGVYVDNAPVCLTCCDQLAVQPDQVDNDESWKLKLH